MTGPFLNHFEKTLKLNFHKSFFFFNSFIQTNLHVGKKVETWRHYQDKKEKKKSKNTNLKIFLTAWLHMLSLLFFFAYLHISQTLWLTVEKSKIRKQKHIYKISTNSYIPFYLKCRYPFSTLCCWIWREKKMWFFEGAAFCQSPHSGTTGIETCSPLKLGTSYSAI